jgi:hypothetical protein
MLLRGVYKQLWDTLVFLRKQPDVTVQRAIDGMHPTHAKDVQLWLNDIVMDIKEGVVTASYDRRAADRRVGSKPKNYAEWLKSQDYELTRDQFASHRNYVKKVIDTVKSIESLIRNFSGDWEYPNSKLSKEERKVLEEAVRILERSSVPVSLLKVKEDKPMLLL